MMSVYSGAYCNLAATSAEDARTGLFFERKLVVPRSTVVEVQKPPPPSFLQSLAIRFSGKWRAMAE